MGSTINHFLRKTALLCTVAMFAVSCEDTPKDQPETAPVKSPTEVPKTQLVKTPAFNPDSAYDYIARQVEFGPRVPNTEAHKKCARWLQDELKALDLEVSVQEATVTAYNGVDLNIYNIMGRYKPEAKDRILLCAHWDSRPYADRDTEQRNKPIDGANDGASGVGVLMELARAIQTDSLKPNIGFDIILFDAEDYGKPEASMMGQSNDSWCLGSQYWSNNIPFEDYQPRYGILLDMVGAGNAVFPKEGASLHFAPRIVHKVWTIAAAMNYKDYFVSFEGNPITDDHVYLNSIGKIPTIDIIHYEMARNDFGKFHHTHDDNMDIINKGTLRVVGEVVLQVIYQE